jgi:DNA-binding response OmpR family regulator
MTKKVLLDEETESALQNYSNALLEVGFDVLVVKNQREAVAKIIQDRPDIAVLDCESTHNEIDTAEELMQIKPSMDMIVLTPKGESASKQLEGLNPDLILHSPFSTEQLVSSVIAVANLHPMVGLVSR